MHTGFSHGCTSVGVLQLIPPSIDLLTYITLPLPPCTPLSKVRNNVPSDAETTRASWLLRMFPAETLAGVENVRPPSREKAICTGECVPAKPSNCTQLT